MSRIVQFQVLRGSQAQLLILQNGVDPDTGLTTVPLQTGEMYFAEDTGNFFVGRPGISPGYIQISDAYEINSKIYELKKLNEELEKKLNYLLALEGAFVL